LKSGDKKNAIQQFNKCYKEFISDSREWAQEAAKKCLVIKQIIASGQNDIDKYLNDTIKESKQKLKLLNW